MRLTSRRTLQKGFHRDWKTWKIKMVMEKSWNMQNWSKVMEFCCQSWSFTNFASELFVICKFFAITENLSICVESLPFPVFSAKCRECKIENRDGHSKLRNGHGKIFCQVWEPCYTGLALNVTVAPWPASRWLPAIMPNRPISEEVNNVYGYALGLASYTVARQRLVSD